MKTMIEIAQEVYGANTIWTGPQLLKLKEFSDIVAADERNRLADKLEQFPFGDTAASFAVWIRNGGK